MSVFRGLLSALLSLVLSIRHGLYAWGVFRSSKGAVKTIVVGNLAIGGSGKTPFSDMILNQLKRTHRLAFLSRGYGRSTRGFLKIDQDHSAEHVGDEPLLIASHHPDIPAYVGEKRVQALKKMAQFHPNLNWVVLDDAFQHRALKGDINILLSRFGQPFYHDHLWPMGDLRDLRARAHAADLIVFTGAPANLSADIRYKMMEESQKYSSAKVFFAHTASLPLQPLFGHNIQEYQIFGSFCGIAHPKTFHENIQVIQPTKVQVNFKDHHLFNDNDLQTIQSKMVNFGGQVEAWITTEKDAIRIRDLNLWKNVPVFYLPIVLKINEEEVTEWNLWWKKRI